MADISIPGINSKYNTEELVKGLVDVEKTKLTSMEAKVTEFEDEKKIWQDFNRKLSSLRTSSRSLFGFENPFSDKLVESSNERILTAIADRDAEEQEMSLTVLRTAEADKFISPSLPADEKVPPGRYGFKIGDDEFSLNYRGGKLSDFARRLESKSDGLLKLTVVRDTPDTQVILFESTATGANNRLVFQEDALDWALDRELIKPSETDDVTIPLDPGSADEAQKAFLKPETSRTVSLPSDVPVESGMFLEYTVKVSDIDPNTRVPAKPPEPKLPPTAAAEFQGVKVESFDSRAEIPAWEPPPLPPVKTDSVPGYFRTASGDISLPDLPAAGSETPVEVRVPLSDDYGSISSIELVNGNTLREVTISDMKIVDPRTADGYVPVNPMSTAGNALIDFNGIKVERDKNDIDDLIPGITLNLNRADPDEEVDIKVEPDVESAKDGIIKFVYNYNQAMTQILILSTDNTDIVHEIEYFTDEERDKAMEDLGKFRGDITLMQLKNRLQRISSSPYPTSLERELSMLSQIGVSTNAGVGGGGGSINASKLRGYLEINEDKLDQALRTKSPAIKELFGLDTDGDLVIDSGVGYEMDSFLNPYIQSGGILANKIRQLDGNIDDTKDDIDDYKEYLADYEADLKRKYGSMEGMLNQLESTSSSLDTFNQQNNQ